MAAQRMSSAIVCATALMGIVWPIAAQEEPYNWTDLNIGDVKVHQLRVDFNNFTSDYVFLTEKALGQLLESPSEDESKSAYDQLDSLCAQLGYELPFPKKSEEFDFLTKILRSITNTTTFMIRNRLNVSDEQCFTIIMKETGSDVSIAPCNLITDSVLCVHSSPRSIEATAPPIVKKANGISSIISTRSQKKVISSIIFSAFFYFSFLNLIIAV